MRYAGTSQAASGGRLELLLTLQAPDKHSVLFLFSDTGGGHRTAARAIDEALHRLDRGRGVLSHHVDAFAACGAFPLREGVFAYGPMLKVQPSPYPALYHLTNGETRFRVVAELGRPFIRNSLRRLFKKLQPSIVVSVHPLLNTYAREAIDALAYRPRLVTCITDLVTIHHAWTMGAVADAYIVGSPEARGVCADRGIPLSRVFDLGLPIRDGFAPPHVPKAQLKAALGLDPQRRVVLVMAGGEGGGRVRKILDGIAGFVRAAGVQLVVIAGRNVALRAKLEATRGSLGAGALVLGFVDNVADYMRAADVLLTKAGPGTIVEAAACGLPVILFDYISGQEAGNLDYVQSRGAGAVALDPHEVRLVLRRWFKRGSNELEEVAARALRSARPNAARDIAKYLLDEIARGEAAARATAP